MVIIRNQFHFRFFLGFLNYVKLYKEDEVLFNKPSITSFSPINIVCINPYPWKIIVSATGIIEVDERLNKLKQNENLSKKKRLEEDKARIKEVEGGFGSHVLPKLTDSFGQIMGKSS